MNTFFSAIAIIFDMNIIIRTGFERVIHDITFQPETIPKGKGLVEANHVRNIEEHRVNGESFLIQAQVIRQTSVTSPPYCTKLNIDAARKVTGVSCTCVYNKSGHCKHIAAVIYYINNEDSLTKTDFEQQWGKPTARQFAREKYSKGKYFVEIFPPQEKIKVNTSKLDPTGLTAPSPLRTIMLEAKKDEDEKAINNLMNHMLQAVDVLVERDECETYLNIFFSMCEGKVAYVTSQRVDKNLYDFYIEKIVLTRNDIVHLCCDTLEQSKCDNWFRARNLRISASKSAHNIKSRVKKSLESLVADILYPKRIDTASTRYGIDHEKKAQQEYEKLYGTKVKKIGMIVSEKQPWLCASLDGIVIDVNKNVIGIVEFKCPSSCKKQSIVNFDSKKCNVNYLHFQNDQVRLKQSSVYYTQCQIQMYVTGTDICDLFIYSLIENGSICVKVERNEPFLKTVVSKCEDFFFQHYLPELHNKIVREESRGNVIKEVKGLSGIDISNQI